MAPNTQTTLDPQLAAEFRARLKGLQDAIADLELVANLALGVPPPPPATPDPARFDIYQFRPEQTCLRQARLWLWAVALASVAFFIYTLLAAWFAPPCRPPVMLFILAVIWGVAPPLFWWFEWFFVFRYYRNADNLETFKYGAQLSLAIWAAVVVSIAAYSNSDYFKPAAPSDGKPSSCLYEARQFHGRWSLWHASTWALSADVPASASEAHLGRKE
ncbi:hypothetical protein [Paraburkholderia sp. J41]|uniref:hypothetical protein n=1 Tax=Paraburkholderia sp. J41 TaxID=2805433 RepID=UPI002AC36A5A|nr:hypothetical protein [Paraburkholderia sp. J41]